MHLSHSLLRAAPFASGCFKLTRSRHPRVCTPLAPRVVRMPPARASLPTSDRHAQQCYTRHYNLLSAHFTLQENAVRPIRPSSIEHVHRWRLSIFPQLDLQAKATYSPQVVKARARSHRCAMSATDAYLIARYDGRAPRYTSYPTASHLSGAVGSALIRDGLPVLPDRRAAVALRACAVLRAAVLLLRLQHRRGARWKARIAPMRERLIAEIGRVGAAIGRRAAGAPASTGAAARRRRCRPRRWTRSWPPCANTSRSRPTRKSPSNSIRPRSTEHRLAALGPWASPASVSACRISSRRCRRPSAASNPTSRRRPALSAARALGVHSLNLDLIYGLPLQTVDSVTRTARRALDLGADRVAVFGYAHVPWMKKHQAVIAEASLPGARPSVRAAAGDAPRADGGGRLCRHRPRPLRQAGRRDGGRRGGGGNCVAASRATRPTKRRR